MKWKENVTEFEENVKLTKIRQLKKKSWKQTKLIYEERNFIIALKSGHMKTRDEWARKYVLDFLE